MTDPHVSFSIYISDRERERLEMERRKALKKEQPPPPPQVPISVATEAPTASEAPLSISSDVEELTIDPPTADEEDLEAIFAAQISHPVLTVSNVTDDDTPWKAKQLQKNMAARKSLCDNCAHCGGYEPREVKGGPDSGLCKSCACDLIHHLKSFETDEPRSDEEDDEEEEWEDDDDDDAGDDDAGSSNPLQAAHSEDNYDSEEDIEADDEEGGGEGSF